ncbi:MAG: Na+/H+ antiporter NhaA [Saprospiraceae bacterium]|nr:Na+/H+ antiporter NhaA [Saprospiraceae bacterium]
MRLTQLYREFFESEKSGGIILMACTLLSLALANSALADQYFHLWHYDLGGRPLEFWINDGLMAIFFLLIGLEIEREVYIGELSSLKNAMLPMAAAIGGAMVPALIHFGFNHGTPLQNGFGIPMATDIAFSLGILSLLGSRVPNTLKIFLTAMAIMDDLLAIIIIALFYSKGFSLGYFGLAMLSFAVLLVLNRLKVTTLWVYLALGIVMWYFMLQSGIHATITGVLLAFAIPFGKGGKSSTSYKLQHNLHLPVAFFILPLFALANTGIQIPTDWVEGLVSSNSLGIASGLILGKPLGILCFSLLAVALGICTLPSGIRKRHLLGVGFLAGIGFTMSIFITLLAIEDAAVIVHSKIAILIASLLGGGIGFLILKFTLPKTKIKD